MYPINSVKWKGGAIDTLQLLVILITAVIGTGNREQLKSLNLLGIADVGTRTQIDEFAVLVEADLFTVRHVVQAPQFVVGLAGSMDFFNRFRALAFDPSKTLVLFDDFFHLGLNGFEVVVI